MYKMKTNENNKVIKLKKTIKIIEKSWIKETTDKKTTAQTQ